MLFPELDNRLYTRRIETIEQWYPLNKNAYIVTTDCFVAKRKPRIPRHSLRPPVSFLHPSLIGSAEFAISVKLFPRPKIQIPTTKLVKQKFNKPL